NLIVRYNNNYNFLIYNIENNMKKECRIKHFPVSFFSMILGMTILTITFQKAEQIFLIVEKIIGKYTLGSLHFIFPPFLYKKTTLAQYSICGSLVTLCSHNFFVTQKTSLNTDVTQNKFFILVISLSFMV
ncbi:MAG: hypothetical protein U9O20_01845, partial [Patescibacteria group bacterium]|nr:hypothetical protein [Patescibacteria group bacterium]